LEAKIAEEKEEEEKREKILTYHLKKRTNDLNQLEEELVKNREYLKNK